MPRVPRGLSFTAVALASGMLAGGCRERPPSVETPDETPTPVAFSVDHAGVCAEGCTKLQRCVPELSATGDEPVLEIAARLETECSQACVGYSDDRSALAVQDCLALDSCNAFWGCLAGETARPWLAKVAPVGERSCENLCSQASACAIAQVCEAEAGGTPGALPGKDKRASADGAAAACMADETRRAELDERCLMRCLAAPEDSQARTELIGCLDHVSCPGMLHCLDTWTETAYVSEPASGPVPGIGESCDGFCTRAIQCGAAAEGVELSPDELRVMKEVMTSTYVECAIQCEKDLERSSKAKDGFDRCTATATCDEFFACADEA